MNSQLLHASRRNGAPLFYAGWVGIALFGTLDVIAQGSKDLPYATVLAIVAIVFGAWYTMTTGRVAVIIGLVVAALFGIGQLFYLRAELGPGDNSFWRTTLLDSIGLLAAVLVVVGAVLGLLARRASTR